ncbi:hypothetical protein BC833DRAFT_579090 [Globomyces pollinis-pini]|nr:hypothetical protein BC833DRAFT_579090 [Globomyces pollinis-pini]
MNLSYAKERQIGIEAVYKASHLCKAVFSKLVQSQTIVKTDASPVTIADFGAQAVVNHLIHKHFPNDPIVGEEDSKDLQTNHTLRDQVVELSNSVLDSPLSTEQILTSIDLGNYEGGGKGRFWTLDPIDGTKGFLRGEQFAVCLALIVDGVVQVAIQGCPNLPTDLNDPQSPRGSLFIAVKGQGSFERTLEDVKEKQIFVSNVKLPSETTFCESVEAAHSSQGAAADIASKLGITKQSVRMDSQCKYAIIARGDAGIYLRVPTRADYVEKIWDHAGGSLLVSEAGGQVCDVEGNPLDFTQGRTLKKNKGIIASNQHILSNVVQVVQEVINKKA